MPRLPNYNVRRAVIKRVSDTFVECRFVDREGEPVVQCPIPHPATGQSGGGIFFYPEVGQSVLIARGPVEKPFIVQTIPQRELYFDTEGVENTSISTTSYPRMREGEICIKGPTGACLNFFKKGNVSVNVEIGNKGSNLEFSTNSESLFTRISNNLSFTEAGRKVEGVIKRDVALEEQSKVTNTFNFLDGEAYDRLLKSIGRSPNNETAYRTTRLARQFTRNPSLIEKRSIVYEYAESYNVNGLDSEAAAMESADPKNPTKGFNNLVADPSARQQRRTDVLNLNLNNYNHLIEKVEGTLVDIYGNVLDINRNIIPVPDTDSIKTDNATNAKNGLRNIYSHLRRSVKMHYEINSRKDIPNTEPSKKTVSDNYGKNFSKFSIDIDGEGLTKLNIPASSETGNIPILGRYVNSRDKDNKSSGSFRDNDRRDIRVLPFSPDGPSISNSTYRPKIDGAGTITAGTAYHNIFDTAESIFQKGKHGSEEGVLSDTISNEIGNNNANAGGRSLHANLDGSAELSIGADTADRKSLVLDLAGGMISHFGRDNNGKSIVHQSDGDVILQIGGNGVNDSRFEDSSDDSRPGRLEIHLVRPDGEPQRIIIDEEGITISVQGNAVYSSTGSTTISAGGRLTLHGEIIGMYGSHDEDIDGTRAGTGYERLVSRNGKIIA